MTPTIVLTAIQQSLIPPAKSARCRGIHTCMLVQVCASPVTSIYSHAHCTQMWFLLNFWCVPTCAWQAMAGLGTDERAMIQVRR